MYAAHVLSAQLRSLDPQRYEELVAALVGELYPDAARVGAKDSGVDVWVPSQGWAIQCKRHSSKIDWKSCEGSLRAARESFQFRHYTFVFPVDLSGPAQRTFDQRLGAPDVDHWGVTQLRNKLALHPQWAILLGGPSSVRVEADAKQPQPSVLFMGREKELESLERRLESDRVAVVHGLDGVGKTELGAVWCRRQSGRVEHCWWLVASDVEALRAGARRIGHDLRLPMALLDGNDVVASVADALQALEDPWVLVLDDAVQPADVAPLLRPAPAGMVLVTTLNPHWREIGLEAMELRPLEAGVAARLLQARSGRGDDADLRALADDALGGLPLALTQVGAYLEQRPTLTTAAYREAFATRAGELLARDDADGNRTVATVWSLSIEQATELEPAARELLGTIAHLAPDRIPISIFQGVAAGSLGDPEVMAETIGALHRFSLIGVDADLGGLSVHRLVQLVAREAESEDHGVGVCTAATLMLGALPERLDEHEGVPSMRPLVDHALAAADHAADFPDTRLLAAGLLSAVGNFTRITGSFRLAKELFSRAVTVADATPKDAPYREEDRSRFLNNYASICAETGDFDTALDMRRQALRICEEIHGTDHERTIKVVANLAGVLADAGKAEEALPLARRAWERRRHGPPEVRAWGAYDLAGILSGLSLHDEALEYLGETISIFAGPEAGSRGNLAWALELRAEVLLALERPREARRDALESLAIRQAAGERHTDVARSWLACALISQYEGNLKEARMEATRALELTDEQLVENHPDRVRARRIADSDRGAGAAPIL